MRAGRGFTEHSYLHFTDEEIWPREVMRRQKGLRDEQLHSTGPSSVRTLRSDTREFSCQVWNLLTSGKCLAALSLSFLFKVWIAGPADDYCIVLLCRVRILGSPPCSTT